MEYSLTVDDGDTVIRVECQGVVVGLDIVPNGQEPTLVNMTFSQALQLAAAVNRAAHELTTELR